MLEVIRGKQELTDIVLSQVKKGRSVGFVPTMGALHAGHIKLINQARTQNDFVVVSVFVNPTQFDDKSDFNNYKRDEDADIAACRNAEADVMFCPDVKEIYPSYPEPEEFELNILSCQPVFTDLEAKFRPGHFIGVVNVLNILFSQAPFTRAYFGEKDYQQLLVVKALVRRYFNFLEIVPVKTVRDHDLLALSSRNERLSKEERQKARLIPQALLECLGCYKEGERDVSVLESRIKEVLSSDKEISFQYGVIRDADSLDVINDLKFCELGLNRGRILLAVKINSVRLIDNTELNKKGVLI